MRRITLLGFKVATLHVNFCYFSQTLLEICIRIECSANFFFFYYLTVCTKSSLQPSCVFLFFPFPDKMTHHCTKFSGHWKVSLQKTETQIHSSTSPEGPLNQFTSFFSPGFFFNTMPRLEGKNTLSPELLRATRLCLQTFWFFNHFHLLNICLLVSYRLLYRNRTGHKILTLQ